MSNKSNRKGLVFLQCTDFRVSPLNDYILPINAFMFESQEMQLVEMISFLSSSQCCLDKCSVTKHTPARV